MEHQIIVNVTGTDVEARPNPLESLNPWDSVTWVFQGLEDGLLPLVAFRQVRPLPPGEGIGSDCGPLGPFEKLSIGKDRILGSGDDGSSGRFIYEVFTVDPRSASVQKLRWRNPPEFGNFGGLDRSGPPP